MKHLLNRATILWVLLLAQFCASAQENGGELTTRILVFERVGEVKTLQVAYKEGEPGSEVELHTNNFTGPYELKQRSFALMNGEKVAARVTIPETIGGKVLLVLIPSPEEDRMYGVLPVADSRADFGPGERKLINLTKWEIAGRLEKRTFKLPSGQIVHLPSVGKPNERHKLAAEFFFKEEDKWIPFTSTYWQHDPETHSLVFFYQQPGRKAIRIKGISEVVPAGE